MRTCPRCGIKRLGRYGALSRVDNRTTICDQCGVTEALMDFARVPLPPKTVWASAHPVFCTSNEEDTDAR